MGTLTATAAEGATIVEVELRASADAWTHDYKIRKVTVPPGVPVTPANVFRYGQNENCCQQDRRQDLPSVSVGDIIRLNGKRFQVQVLGFRPVG